MPDSEMAAGLRVQKLSYDGRVGALYWIFIKILLLNIITVGIYRFWGKTRLRSYVWSHMELQGERFEYTGTGGELFIGFLIVTALFAVAYAILLGVHVVFGPTSPQAIASQFVLPIAFIYLPMVAIYAAQRYRLTRTLWRGIRGGMSGSAWTYGLRAFGYALLAAMTFGLAAPWVQMRLAEQRFNNSYFGDAKAHLQGKAGPLYKGFIIGFIVYVVLMGILVSTLMSVFHITTLLEQLTANQGDTDPQTKLDALKELFSAYLLLLVSSGIIGIVAFSWYAAALFKAIASGLTFDNLTFRSTMGAWDYCRFWLGNSVILVITLGIGFPVVVQRGLRFFANRLEIIGEIDIDRLKQNTLPKPKTGEGLLETFDAGFW